MSRTGPGSGMGFVSPLVSHIVLLEGKSFASRLPTVASLTHTLRLSDKKGVYWFLL